MNNQFELFMHIYIKNQKKMERRGHGLNTNILDAHLNQINNQFGANFTFGSKLLQ